MRSAHATSGVEGRCRTRRASPRADGSAPYVACIAAAELSAPCALRSFR